MYDLLGKKTVLYGLSTETERVLTEWNGQYNVIGLLDGFKSQGEQFGYPILDINEVIKLDKIIIIVVARPGSCKAITHRIGHLCRENNIELFDIRGKNLLEESRVVYDFSNIKGYTKRDLLSAINNAEIVSFDLFDTLVVRNISSFNGLLKLVDARLREKNIYITDFVNRRIKAEKVLSVHKAPRLEEIYSEMLKNSDEANAEDEELSDVEFEADIATIEARKEVTELLKELVKQKKKVYITSDSYYSKEQICDILEKIGIVSVERVLVSCEYHTSKTGDLFEHLKTVSGGTDILHIGDDIVADVESAKRHGINSFQIYSPSELLELLGGLRLEKNENTLSDQIKAGMFTARLFNSPFQFEDEAKRIHAEEAEDIGYLFCAPMIMDFTEWFEKETRRLGNTNRWLCARDGYLIKKIYEIMYPAQKAEYFHTSRISAIRAGTENVADIEYVNSMKFSGKCEDNLKVRFGINAYEIAEEDTNEDADGLLKYSKAILDNSKTKRKNNLKYIEKLYVREGGISFFDFVAKGTSQMYVQRLVHNPIQGLYFLQLEPEFMKDKKLNIKPFFAEAERENSGIFDNYYVLETILTSPEPSVDEFDEAGNAVYAEETRSDKDIACLMRVHKGITEYVSRFLEICPESERNINKKLDEVMLTLINNIEIRDADFYRLTVEDPFFNRMTKITELLPGETYERQRVCCQII